MSAVLHLPLDYEQLPELWQLKELLQTANESLRTATLPTPPALTPKQIEASASWIFTRLFVSLGYQARSNNRPGFLSLAGAAQLRSTFEPYFGDDCNVIELLERSGLLKAGEGGWICELFSHSNPHLAGNFKPPHLTGNVNSRFQAAYKNIIGDAAQQTLMMLPGIFRQRDGAPMGPRECESAVVLIRALDRAIADPGAHAKNSSLSEGLMAAAGAVMATHKPADLMPFYYWLANHYEHPLIPKKSEEILADFEKYYALMNK